MQRGTAMSLSVTRQPRPTHTKWYLCVVQRVSDDTFDVLSVAVKRPRRRRRTKTTTSRGGDDRGGGGCDGSEGGRGRGGGASLLQSNQIRSSENSAVVLELDFVKDNMHLWNFNNRWKLARTGLDGEDQTVLLVLLCTNNLSAPTIS